MEARYALQFISETIVFQFFGNVLLALSCPAVTDWAEVTSPMQNHFHYGHLNAVSFKQAKSHFLIGKRYVCMFQSH